MARVQLDYFMGTEDMADRCTQCKTTTMPEVTGNCNNVYNKPTDLHTHTVN
eukprot:COSAG02_NODE_10929_length_1830_cov_2.502600_4_plen_50_part_01